MDASPFAKLPDELLEAIILHLPPTSTHAFALSCRRTSKIAHEPRVWRRHCLAEYRYWQPHHELKEKLSLPPAQTPWRQLFAARRRTDTEAADLFEALLLTQQERYARMERIANWGYDVKDLLLGIVDGTPEDAEDVLARRYHANAILGSIHRMTAVEKWMRLQRQQMVRLEEVLGAYDLFVLAGRRGDLSDIDREFDRIAENIRLRDPDFDELSVRRKAEQIAKYLRSEKLVGNPNEENYHALRNNFISMALFEEPHTSLPLQSVAIYCAVARRLGVNARPSNYPHHVHAVIEAPPTHTLDGKPRPITHPPRPDNDDQPPDETAIMHMDPWRSSTETPRSDLLTRLIQMGIPPSHHPHCLAATSNLEIALRTGRNLMNSVSEARDLAHTGISTTITTPPVPDIDAAWYSMLWSMFILGESSAASALHRRRQILPYLIEHYQAHFPEDLGLIERIVPPLLEGQREWHVLLHLITTARKADRNRRAPCYRAGPREPVGRGGGEEGVERGIEQSSSSSASVSSPPDPSSSSSFASAPSGPQNPNLPSTGAERAQGEDQREGGGGGSSRGDDANNTTAVTWKIGTYFRHKRYRYAGIVIGWDTSCGAEPAWIEQMRVDDLPRGRHQPFFNVV
ncbi:hypothetical protein KC360_g9152 [Hortaea werneckii]|nr:hypothetical protein KC361_g9447 [Hortaea werneckii]KAI6877485.1 hypothetical protein KC325_g9164 [Hortaea werneckii]KAI6985226.1 hypothetical protein KC359_g9206 [Hortaea werneckii]KAI7139783.1 hypothetical protein KC344_g9140 [Hortaea werneckii]KAI7166441.1 hypothetical protein KC360_g9152 [Hortaea werneckii]